MQITKIALLPNPDQRLHMRYVYICIHSMCEFKYLICSSCESFHKQGGTGEKVPAVMRPAWTNDLQLRNKFKPHNQRNIRAANPEGHSVCPIVYAKCRNMQCCVKKKQTTFKEEIAAKKYRVLNHKCRSSRTEKGISLWSYEVSPLAKHYKVRLLVVFGVVLIGRIGIPGAWALPGYMLVIKDKNKAFAVMPKSKVTDDEELNII